MSRPRLVLSAVWGIAWALVLPMRATAQDWLPGQAAPRSRDAIARAAAPFAGLRFDSADERSRGDREAARAATPARRCPGCPERRIGPVFLVTTGVNVLYNLGNKARGETTARVTPASWATNLRHGWEWDTNPFLVNQIGHPYQGSNYFTAGRAYGLSFWESSAAAAFGSAMWEYFGENNRASLNDIINTTLGGIALGEMFHRAAWLVRDTRMSGLERTRQEIMAAAIDPLGGLARLMSGDAARVVDKPALYVPSALAADAAGGALWQGTTARDIDGSAAPYAEVDLRYGDTRAGRVRTPYEAFTVRMRFGGGTMLSDARVRGKLFGQPLGSEGRFHLSVAQTYDYVSNRAYDFGGQGVEAGIGTNRSVTPRTSVWLSAWGGLTALGAVDSRFPTPREGDADLPREYDYGPGSTFGGTIRFSRDRRQLFGVTYQGYHIFVVDGLRANHVLQRAQFDILAPIRWPYALGFSAEYFYRKTYFQPVGERHDRFSQARLYVSRTMADIPVRDVPRSDLAPAQPPESRLWLMGGGGLAVARAGCGTCPTDGVYRRTGGLSVNAGARLTSQMDAGLELAWVPADVDNGEPVRAWLLLGVAQFRPWACRGFFMKGGMGVGIVRNWIPDLSAPRNGTRFRSSALAMGYGAGWIRRLDRRVSLQLHGTHHVAALGDLTTSQTVIQNVVGNFWIVGAGIVLR